MGLKALPRAGWVRAGVQQPESVAAHSWGVGWLVLVLCPEGVNRERALAMAVVHDLPEIIAGDITPHDGVSGEDKHAREASALAMLTGDLPAGDEVRTLWNEYEAGATPEARFVKACDKLDMALQASVYAADQGVDTAEFVTSALEKLPEGLLSDLAGQGFHSRPF